MHTESGTVPPIPHAKRMTIDAGSLLDGAYIISSMCSNGRSLPCFFIASFLKKLLNLNFVKFSLLQLSGYFKRESGTRFKVHIATVWVGMETHFACGRPSKPHSCYGNILKVLNHTTRIPALVVNQLWIWLNKLLLLLCPDLARLPPLPGTQPLVIQTSQCLLLSVYYTALFSLQAVSTTHAQ